MWLEIIATIYASTIINTHVCVLYSHLCIYVSILLPINTRYIWTNYRGYLRENRGASEDNDRVNSVIDLEAVIM